MQKHLLLKSIALLCCISSAVLAKPKLCVAFNNYTKEPLQVETSPSPGFPYTVEPNANKTFSLDDMTGCTNNKCVIKIASVQNKRKAKGEYYTIRDIPRGTRIMYYGSGKYQIGGTKVPCE